MKDPVEQITKHPLRRSLIEALWRSSEPLSARRYRSEYADSSETLERIAYHLGVLEREGVAETVRPDAEGPDFERLVVLAGPNCSAVLRRLRLT